MKKIYTTPDCRSHVIHLQSIIALSISDENADDSDVLVHDRKRESFSNSDTQLWDTKW